MKKNTKKMNYPVLKGRGIPLGASSFGGLHPRSKERGIHAAKIKGKIVKNCLFCEKEGVLLYEKMRDRFFNVPGSWFFLRCPNCEFVWLNPHPDQKEINKFYAEYYTHAPISQNKPPLRTPIRQKIKMSLLAANFSFKEDLKIEYSKLMRIVFKATPVLKNTFGKRAMMYLGKSDGKKLLDVGCGNGSFLSIMQNLGWEVKGVEPDKKAADFVQKKLGIKVINQNFEEAKIQKKHFDAIVMRHVIEHTEDPINFLKKGWEILKPGGKLVVVTPNIESLGHLIFKNNWLHLDPPRHLFIFSPRALTQCAKIGGLEGSCIKVVPAAGELTYIRSSDIKKMGKVQPRTTLAGKIAGISFQLLEIFLSLFKPKLGEELVLEAIKENDSNCTY